VADVVRDVQPSIVLIRVGGTRVNPSKQPMNEPVIAGTGFVVDARGYIATNDHVVAGAPDWPSPALEVHLADGKRVVASLVGRDPASDLAVIKVGTGGLKPLRFAQPAALEVGRDVVAIGFALDQEGMPSVTRGILSATHRELASFGSVLSGMLQTDAAINPGNSGGPLLTLDAAVVGVNESTLERGHGISYAISSRLAEPVVRMLIESGSVRRASVGVAVVTVTRGAADELLHQGMLLSEGALVRTVERGSPVAGVGVAPGDKILQLGEYLIRNVGDLNNALVWLRPGQTVKLTYLHYPEGKFGGSRFAGVMVGTPRTVEVRLGP